jgi:lysophospholipase L1-like esterase
MKTIVLIGDSIRMGYQETVRTQLSGWAEVWAPADNGGTSENVLAHFDEWVIEREPDILHINCGLHDLKKEFGRNTAAVPIGRYAENVRTILSRANSELGARVIWALTTPVNQEWHRENKPFDRFEADVVAYNSVAANIARESGVVVNDLFAAVMSAGRDSLLLPDGVHFRPEAYVLLGKTVAACIRGFAEGMPHTADEATP